MSGLDARTRGRERSPGGTRDGGAPGVTGDPGRVAVVGGGIAGLSAAHYLVEAGADVELYEASDRFGGLGTFFEHEGDELDRFYHVLLPTDEHLFDLMDDLGIRDRAYWREASLGFMYDRELYPLEGPLDLLRFEPARFVDRLRLGFTALWASYVASPEPLDDITVEEWLTRLSGERAFDRLWRPLLEAKFGDAYRRIPALWYWASFNREKGTQKEVKGYLEGGYKGLTDALVSSLRARGARLHLEAPVRRLDLGADDRPVVQPDDGEPRTYDRVVTTVPFFFLRKMTEGGAVAPWLEQIHADVDYQGVMNVVVMLRESASEHYWIPVVESDVPFQGIVETTRVIDLEDTGGRHLVYLLNYVHRDDPLFAADENDIRERYLEGLLELMPHLDREDVLDARLFKAPFVEPLYTPGYGKRKPPEELVPGRVYLATTTQVYPNVTSWNSSTEVSRRAVDALLEGAGSTVGSPSAALSGAGA